MLDRTSEGMTLFGAAASNVAPRDRVQTLRGYKSSLLVLRLLDSIFRADPPGGVMTGAWNVDWANYYGPVTVVMDDQSVVLGEAIGHHTEADTPLMLVDIRDAYPARWVHPRYVSPVLWGEA